MGTAISLFWGEIIILNILYKKMLGLDIFRFFYELFKVVPTVVPPTVGSVLYKYWVTVDSWGTLIGGMVLFVVIYAICICWFGLNNEERTELTKQINKIRYRAKC